MSFFKGFKEDLSQAVNELLPNDENKRTEADEQMVNTLEMQEPTSNEAAETEKMMELLDGFTNDNLELDYENADKETETTDDIENDIEVNNLVDQIESEEDKSMDDNVDLELLNALDDDEDVLLSEDEEMSEASPIKAASLTNDDEVSVISRGTTINGSITSDASLDVIGNVTGDIECLGKLSISGKVVGNVSASEIFINTDRLEGNVVSDGSVKIGLGTVLIGDVTGTSGVIAGAVKGEIDINGPIVIDSTAIIKGNIKAKSVQINNGAIIDGFCSLCYSDVNIDNIFE